MAYNKDTDYQALINEAVAKGDYRSAAQYEQQRNEKIKDLDATGTNKWNATATYKYTGWLDPTDYSILGKEQMASGASARDVMDTYNKRYNKAVNTEGLTQYANDDIQKEMWNYIMANLDKGSTAPGFHYSGIQSAKPTYQSGYSDRIDKLLDQLLNREQFSYSAENDPLYQQYRSQYSREGNRAVNDTLAAASSNAGGMNSYAMTAAQQAGSYYAAQLADKLPELYQLAYDLYMDGIDGKVRDLNLLQDMDNNQYSRYRDTMSDWRNDRDFAYSKYRDDMGDWQWNRQFDYNAAQDQIANDRWQTQWDYNVGRDQLEDQRYQTEWDYEVAQDKAKAQAQAQQAQAQAKPDKPTELKEIYRKLADSGVKDETTAKAQLAAWGYTNAATIAAGFDSWYEEQQKPAAKPARPAAPAKSDPQKVALEA